MYDERTGGPNAEFVRNFSQRRAIRGITCWTLNEDTRFGQSQHLNRRDLRKERLALRACNGYHGSLCTFATQHNKIGAAVGIAAEQQRRNRIRRHWPVVVLHTDAAVWQRNQVLYCSPCLCLGKVHHRLSIS